MCVTLCVTGCFILIALAELHVQPLNHSVIFMKERDVIFSNDQWRVAINGNDISNSHVSYFGFNLTYLGQSSIYLET